MEVGLALQIAEYPKTKKKKKKIDEKKRLNIKQEQLETNGVGACIFVVSRYLVFIFLSLFPLHDSYGCGLLLQSSQNKKISQKALVPPTYEKRTIRAVQRSTRNSVFGLVIDSFFLSFRLSLSFSRLFRVSFKIAKNRRSYAIWSIYIFMRCPLCFMLQNFLC